MYGKTKIIDYGNLIKSKITTIKDEDIYLFFNVYHPDFLDRTWKGENKHGIPVCSCISIFKTQLKKIGFNRRIEGYVRIFRKKEYI